MTWKSAIAAGAVVSADTWAVAKPGDASQTTQIASMYTESLHDRGLIIVYLFLTKKDALDALLWPKPAASYPLTCKIRAIGGSWCQKCA